MEYMDKCEDQGKGKNKEQKDGMLELLVITEVFRVGSFNVRVLTSLFGAERTNSFCLGVLM